MAQHSAGRCGARLAAEVGKARRTPFKLLWATPTCLHACHATHLLASLPAGFCCPQLDVTDSTEGLEDPDHGVPVIIRYDQRLEDKLARPAVDDVLMGLQVSTAQQAQQDAAQQAQQDAAQRVGRSMSGLAGRSRCRPLLCGPLRLPGARCPNLSANRSLTTASCHSHTPPGPGYAGGGGCCGAQGAPHQLQQHPAPPPP